MANEKKSTAQAGTNQVEAQIDGQLSSTSTLELAVTADDIRREYPDAADAIYQSGLAAGAEAERNRIRDVEAQALPGHEKLVASLKFDGKTTGPEAASQVLAAERSLRETRMSNLKMESPGPIPPSISTDDGTMTLSGAEADEKEWNSNAELRAEFGDQKDAYLAYKKKEREGNKDK